MTDVPLGSGFLHLKDEDISILYRKQSPGSGMPIDGIYLPIDFMNAFGEFRITISLSKKIFLAGEKFSLGEGCIVPFDSGLRLYDPTEPRLSRWNISLIRTLIRSEVRVLMTFRTERIK